MVTKEELIKLHNEKGDGKVKFEFDGVTFELFKAVSGDFYGVSTCPMLISILKDEDYKDIEVVEESEDPREEIKKLREGFAKLTDIVSPYCDDFTGITENGEFDVILAVKELLEIAYPNECRQPVMMSDEDETPFLGGINEDR